MVASVLSDKGCNHWENENSQKETYLRAVYLASAERVGFEPTVAARTTTVFETAPIVHSGTSPWLGFYYSAVQTRVLRFLPIQECEHVGCQILGVSPAGPTPIEVLHAQGRRLLHDLLPQVHNPGDTADLREPITH